LSGEGHLFCIKVEKIKKVWMDVGDVWFVFRLNILEGFICFEMMLMRDGNG